MTTKTKCPPHHWILGDARDGVVDAVCKRCKERTEFRPNFDSAHPTSLRRPRHFEMPLQNNSSGYWSW